MEKPNILIFMTDHQRADTVYPLRRARTPHVDRLAMEGVAFTRTYCTAPHCCPARASFFSGLYPSEHGVWNNVDVSNALSRGLYDGVELFSDALARAGYSLHYSGKWHVSAVESPADRGWKMGAGNGKAVSYRGRFPNRPQTGDWGHYGPQVTTVKERGEGEIVREGYPVYRMYGVSENPYGDRDVMEDAVAVIEKDLPEDRPWCQFVGMTGPHEPCIPPQEFWDLYREEEISLPDNFHDAFENKPGLHRRLREKMGVLTEREWKQAIRAYLAFCSYEDALFGEIMEALERTGKLDNTLVLYLSDHGDYCGEHGLFAKGLPCYLGAYHIPLVMWWKKGIVHPGRTVEAPVSLVDIAPTLTDCAGLAPFPCSGRSLRPFLEDVPPEDWRREIYTQSNGNELYGIQRSVLTDRYHLIYNGFDYYDELYDLQKDPGELVNVAYRPEYREVVRELYRRLWTFALDHADACVNPYFMVTLAPYGPNIQFESR